MEPERPAVRLISRLSGIVGFPGVQNARSPRSRERRRRSLREIGEGDVARAAWPKISFFCLKTRVLKIIKQCERRCGRDARPGALQVRLERAS